MPKWYHRASWALAKGLYSPTLLRRYRVEAKGLDSLPEPPFLLAAGHANFLDPFILGSLVRGPVRFMANLEGVSALGAAVSGLAGCYGRRKGASDIRALRRTFELAASGESIGIFPEGDRSWDGAALPLRPGCGKLARRLGLPLVLARHKGNYLARPRWASRARRGRWSVEFLVFGADELSRLTDGTAEAIIALALARNEIKDAQREGRRFEGERCAEGVGRLLWRCPVCGKTDCIEGRAETIRCSRCLSRWELDANCRVRPLNAPLSIHAAEIGDLGDWHAWQVATLPELASGTERGRPALRSEGVTLSERSDGAARTMGKGVLFLEGSGSGAELVFEGPSARAVFKVGAVRGFVDNFNVFSEFDHRGHRWRLDFGGGNAAKWAYALSRSRALGLAGGPEEAA